VLELSVFSKEYPTAEGGVNRVFRNAGPLLIERGDKLALVGKNGAGKSTLARILFGSEPFEGERKLGHQVVLAHFAQHQADTLDHDTSVLDSLRAASRGHSETELRTLLGAFLFTGDDVFKRVGVLSGGEKSRLALARTLLSPANFLILDEPTNHLDMASKAMLVEALRQYTGSFVVVSHDRHFLDQIVNRVWYAESGIVKSFTGTYSEAQWQRQHGTAARVQSGDGASAPAAQKASQATSGGGRKTKEDKRREAEERNRLYQLSQGGKVPVQSLSDPKLLKRALGTIEKQIEDKETEKANLEEQLANPDLYENQSVFQDTMKAFAAVEAELARLYEQWEKAAAQVQETNA
jgi:ATP-binding cassette, subfamily F, member 3